jgi:hypothetical protein
MKNSKTTILGIIAGALPILQTAVDTMQTGAPVNWISVAFGFAVMAMGILAKDFNVTGTDKL